MSRDSLRKLALLLLAVLGLLSARALHGWFTESARDYYLSLSPQARGRLVNVSTLENCDVSALIRDLAQMAPPEGVVGVGACDLFMYNGGVAVSGFLAFLTLYLAFVVVGFLLHGLAPPGTRRVVLLLWSLAFLAVALPLRPALWLVEGVLVLFLLASVPLPPRVRAVLLLVGSLAMLGTAGRWIVEATSDEFFRLTRLAVAPGTYGPDTPLGAVLAFLHLGTPGRPPLQLDGFPYVFLALAFLLKAFRRVLWLAYDLWVGRTRSVDPLDFGLYFLGLPALVGNSATPPYSEFAASYGRDPGSVVGARTLAVCLGLATVLYVLLVMMGYSPATRILFPACDLGVVSPANVWLRLSAVYAIEYLFLLATEQASIGVARLFGYGLRDNYAHPMVATGMADYWRRWNIYWREFLVSVFFWPTTLALARRRGEPQGWHLVVAAFLTFAATFALNLVPLLLLSGFLHEQFFVSQPTQPGPLPPEPGIPSQGTRLVGLIPSLATYYAFEGLLVSLSLLAEFRRRGPRAPSPWRTALAVAGTFALVAALRVFLTDTLTLEQQFAMLRRAVGLGG